MDAQVSPLEGDHDEDWILLTDPDVSGLELERVIRALRSSRLSAGPLVEDFEAEFAAHHGRAYGVATASGTIGMWLALVMAFNVWFIIWPNQKKALGIVQVEADAKAKAARMAMLTSRFNTMFSVPMLFCMVAQQNGGLG